MYRNCITLGEHASRLKPSFHPTERNPAAIPALLFLGAAWEIQMRDGETSAKPSASADRLGDIFVGDGEMARLMRAKDWSATPLGPPQDWPNALKVALRLLLTSRFEMWLGWGPEIAFFYNDAYRPTLGDKHPASLGMPAKELWAEIWAEVGPLMRSVYDDSQATWNRDMLLLLERRGFPEETYHTFSYSPLIDDDGKVSGLFCAVSEETNRVITGRRMDTLRELAADLSTVDTTRAVLQAVERRLGSNRSDLPFTLTFEFTGDGETKLVAATGGIGAHPAATDAALWQAQRILAGEAAVQIDLKPLRGLPIGAWSLPPKLALAVPLSSPGRDQPAGMLVVGLNPHRTLDDDYTGFTQLLAGQIAAGLSSASAYESERARAEGLADVAALREAAAEELQRLNETLEARVAERTEELAEALDRLQREAVERETVEDALRQAQKMEAVGQLTGGIAHDFNNLLTGVLGSIDLLQKRLAQGRMSEVDRYAATAESAAKRAAALTHRLLAFSPASRWIRGRWTPIGWWAPWRNSCGERWGKGSNWRWSAPPACGLRCATRTSWKARS